ncbi:MAG: transporter substrate-binding domain-containing protein [Cyanobacteria bacterium J06632_22]
MRHSFQRFAHLSLRWVILFVALVGFWGGAEGAIAVDLSHSLAVVLQPGSEGAAVETLQSQLQQRGYFDSEITGLYDDDTQLAVQSFQRDMGLQADGIAGVATQEELADIDLDRVAMPPDIQRILDRGRLIVAVLGSDNPPFFMGDDSSPTGLDIKIAEGLAQSLNVGLEFNRSAETFNEVVDQVYALNADIAISKLSRTFSRAQRVRFSRPYVNMRQGLLVNRVQIAQQDNGSSPVEAIRNFSGKVGVIDGSSYAGFLKQKFPDAVVQAYPTWDDVVDAVIRGDVQAAYRDELEVKKVIVKNPDAALRLQTIALTDTKDPIAMAMPWDSTQLQALVDQYLDTQDLDYTADMVLEEYADTVRADASAA